MKHAALAAALALATSLSAQASSLTASLDAPVFVDDPVAVQFRNGRSVSDPQIFLAPNSNVGDTGNRETAFYTWSLSDAAIPFSFSYDADGGPGGTFGLLTATLGGSTAVYGDENVEIVAGGLTFNALQLNVESRSNGDEAITVANLTVNGHSVPGTFGGDGLFSDFGITGFGTVSDFTVAGSIFRSGTALGTQGARPRVDLRMGNVDMAPIPLPAAGWLLLAGMGGLVAARRARKA